ncbi:MAG: hypothetical protein FVQ83_02505 [Chloroflexi bacterium]|nr:hypothetical protein [Chloroflexota bacterium]
MAISAPTLLTDYQAAINQAVFFFVKDAAFLRISGDDRKDFLQRQTTNDINLLSPSRSIITVLTSPSARILDVIQLIDKENHIGIIPLPGRGNTTFDFLKSKIFFMDKVVIEQASHEFSQFIFDGPKSIEILQEIGIPSPPSKDEIINLKVDKMSITIIGRVGLTSDSGFQLLIPVEQKHLLVKMLESFDAVELSEESFEILRIEAGLPTVGHELTEQYTPLETNLEHAISTTKGCYTGQEVIARQINYDKITKQLVRVKLNGNVYSGATVLVNSKKVGEITSFVNSPRFGLIGLAIIKRPFFKDGTQIIVENNENQVAGCVVAIF